MAAAKPINNQLIKQQKVNLPLLSFFMFGHKCTLLYNIEVL